MGVKTFFTAAEIKAALPILLERTGILGFFHHLRCVHKHEHRLELEEMKTSLLQNQTIIENTNLQNDIKNYFNSLEENARKIVLVVDAKEITDIGNGKVKIASEPLKDRAVSYQVPFCKNIIYGNQQSARANGTGFFIGDNIVATAAHVVMTKNTNITDVSHIRFVQGILISNDNPFTSEIVVDKSQVYKPVENSLIPNSHYWSDFGSDYAVMRVEGAYKGIDYPIVHGVTCPGINEYNQLFASESAKNTRLYALGHGLALPLKVSYHGEIIKANKTFPYFEADLSLLGGNSGSPIFDAETHKLMGIYIRGIKKLKTKTCENSECLKAKEDEDRRKGISNPEKRNSTTCMDVKEENHHSSQEGQECQRLELVLESLSVVQKSHH